MKVVVLVRGDVCGWYATTLMERGHEVAIHGGGAIHGPLIKDYANYDGCLLLGSDPDLLEIADHLEAIGKPVWRNLSDIPKSD
jgi:hypothetical protein